MTPAAAPGAGPGPAPGDDVADLVAAAVRRVPGVADLHGGSFGEVATYLPGRRVPGVRIRDDLSEVHVVTLWGAPVPATADAVRAAVEPIVGTPVHVVVEDVVDPSAGADVIQRTDEETP